MSAPALRSLFAAHGAPVTPAGPFLLGGDTGWLVAQGHVDVFAVRVAEGEPTGARRHLVRVESGGALLGVGEAAGAHGMGLLAAPAVNARLLALPQARLRDAAGGGERDAAAAAVEGWAAALCTGIARDVVPRRSEDLAEGMAITLPAGATVRPVGVVWLRHREGSTDLLGDATLRLSGDVPVPIAAPAWVTAEAEARVAAEAMPEPAEAWRGMARLHGLVLGAAAELAAREETADRDRLRRRAALDRSVLARATGRLASVIETRRAAGGMRMRAADDDEDALFASCRLVAEAQGIAVRPPPAATEMKLASIARASGFQTRTVMLRDDWWRRDSGPMLAFLDAEKRFVALLPVRGRSYVLCDPVERARTPVDGKVAGTLTPFAYAFYRPFDPGPVGIGGLLRFGIRGCGRDVTTLLLVGFAGGALAMAPPIATGLLFNSVIPGAERAQLAQLTAVLLAVAVAAALFQLTRAVALTRIEGKAGAAVQAAVWDRLLSLPPGFFRARAAGDLASRAMGVDSIREALSGATATALLGLVFSTFNFALLFHYSGRLAGWATLMAGILVAATIASSFVQLRRQRVLSRLQAEIEGVVLQLLTGIAKLRAAAAEARAFGLWAERFAEQRRLRYAVRRAAGGLASFNAAFPVLAQAVIFAAAAAVVGGDHGMKTGDFLAFMAAFGAFTGALLTTSQAVTNALAAVPQYEIARPILEAEPETDLGRADPGVLTGQVSMQHLFFRYSVDGGYVLNDLSLNAEAGEFVALVGPSGSGKSTLLRLLLGFEQPESGSIFFDGQELGGLDLLALRRQIGVVLQNGRLMPGDLFSNIVGSTGALLEDAWEAARMSGLDGDIKAMPMGMHTVVSEGGSTLSGGQRQRLMIARAIVTRPRILLFDEATSALDNRTQAIVADSLAGLRSTRLVIAHRLSTVIHADRICVIQKGTVVQSGRYEELMEVDGPFRELARRQIA
ncbi:NHLP bacteriocin export ABC transporter permease/ATPase subunit [Longimicrobium sp.]|uniref:NHLP bacteriocin export ABC transporter permease/ATPase subunit n=1 Tax=Longimicrobium sp. TaxID=2029185 RepID=UPI002CA4E09B|nr:NHLP bacteriocin export ABC transporter permease/ATPase subunit [Longimicrobium sp.]HSU14673.1 NHLP bacteriocin export ABC transporter permease/ATPase subunit [Longimicrobium sp.]